MFLDSTAQVPQGFNYQAIVRDGSNEIIANKGMTVTIALHANSGTGALLWEEDNAVTSDQFGLVSFVVGDGSSTGGLANFTDIDWNAQTVFLKTTVEYPAGVFTVMGTTQIWAVPYSLVAKDVEGPVEVEKIGITGTTTDDEEALFEVKNHGGQTVFAVYNEGVRIYVNDIDTKGAKGGFAIGGFGIPKTIPHQYLFISGDSVRVYIDNTDTDKGPKGGFAIGGFGVAKKGPQQFLTVSNDSVRIYVDNNETDKGVKGGFAIGGYGVSKGKPQKLLTVSDDSVRIYINDAAKGVKGGFAIGGFDKTKGDGANINFFNVSTDASDTINPSEPRILWYPLKNAFLTGQVLIELTDSVGINSTATGYESKAVGDWSQAMGYMAIARGDYSTAIGNNAIAHKDNSFAFGDNAKSSGTNSFSFGKGAVAMASGSYAFGSQGYTDEMEPTRFTIANGSNSFAIGMGAQTNERLAIAIGTDCTASGVRSVALGSGSEATAFGAVALGTASYAYGNYSFAANFHALASGANSVALGDQSEASGYGSLTANIATKAQSYCSFVIGRFNIVSGTTNSWVATEPLFIIGNGSSASSRANAVTVLKNGNVAIGHNAPTQQLDLSGQIRIRGGSPAAGEILTSDADGNATWETPASHTHSSTDITSGTLPVTRGGTGNSTLTANKVLVGNGTSAVLYPTNLHWDNANSRLGIADVTPSFSLDVAGAAQIQQSAWLATSSGNVGIGITSAATKLRVNGNLAVGTYDAATANGLAVSGNVGIGTSSPSQKLHIENTSGAVKILVNGSSGTSSLEYNISGTYVGAFGANLDNDYIFIYHGGNVSVKNGMMGIGNTNPGQKLDITAGYGRVETGYSWLTNSDVRYKKNITELQESLEKVLNLRGVRFDLADDVDVVDGEGKYIGFIAQELEEVYPEFVVTGENGYKSVAYDKIGPVLVEAIKEQQKHIESQDEKIARLEKMVQE
ncbi:MAG: tail fiber domain-containing protein, partial [Bacteroidia bacterium]|nr:tail fiber domain-containing protein [Bacteroidia bacterium]